MRRQVATTQVLRDGDRLRSVSRFGVEPKPGVVSDAPKQGYFNTGNNDLEIYLDDFGVNFSILRNLQAMKDPERIRILHKKTKLLNCKGITFSSSSFLRALCPVALPPRDDELFPSGVY